jgi:hypothetical protein
MRLLEIVLIVADFFTVVLCVVPRLRAIGWTRSIVLITLVVAVVQILVEGARWQLVPAYVLTGLFLLVWGGQRFVPSSRLVTRILSRHWVKGGAIVLCLLDLLLAATLCTVLPIFQFPRPSGPYQIGTVIYHWVERRHELFSTDPYAHRELMAQIWYPAKGDRSPVRAPYVQDASALSSAVAPALHVPGFTFNYFQEIPTHAIPSAPVATVQPTYPVLIFLTGVMGYRQSNTFQVEELVSRGYIVVGLDQLTALNRADPNGLLTGRLDLRRVGTFGVSLGAMVASEACHRDARLKACLMMDAAMSADVVQAGLRQPGMWLTRPASDMQLEHWSEADIAQTLSTMWAVFNKEPARDGYYVSIPGMFHVNFTDGPYFTPRGSLLNPPFAGPINAQRGFDIINAYSLAFFDQHLEGHPAALLAGPSPQYPEVLFAKSSLCQTPLP